MRVKLLKDHKGRRAGVVYVPAWEAEARALVAKGIAEPVGRETAAKSEATAPEPKSEAAKPKKAKAPRKRK